MNTYRMQISIPMGGLINWLQKDGKSRKIAVIEKGGV